MIARSWTARSSRAGTLAYTHFFRTTLMPQLAVLDGHRGALVLEDPSDHDDTVITVVTFWESMEAVARFAGSSPDLAVVEPEARAVLRSFDDHVKHHRVLLALGEGHAVDANAGNRDQNPA